jgi:CubicO group peptidase (beta-lactamase class C family)
MEGTARALNASIEERLARRDTPGVALALLCDGEPALAGGFGYRDRETGLVPDGETVFGCGSVTKMVTALAVLLLQEDGRLHVDEPVTRFLPEFRLSDNADASRVRLSHLLCHTSGLPPLPGRHYAVLAAAELEDWEREEIEQLLAHWPAWRPIERFEDLLSFLAEYPYRVLAAPGERFSYSNEGYSLLGLVIERVAGMPYARFVAERILAPCGMARSGIGLAPVLSTDNATAPYARRGAVVRTRGWFHAAALYSGGQLRSTANDLVRFVEMLRCGGAIGGQRVAHEETIAQMIAPRVRIDAMRSYGFGTIRTQRPDGLLMIGHSGGHKGVSAHAAFVPDRGVSCAVLTNAADGPAQEIWDAAVRTALNLDEPPLARPATVQLSAAERARFIGRYGSGESGVALDVALNSETLVVEAGGRVAAAVPVAVDALAWDGAAGLQEARFVADPEAPVDAPFAWAFYGLRHQPRLPADFPSPA